MRSNWIMHHLGIPVHDLDRAMAGYRALANVTFENEFLIDSSRIEEYLVYGRIPDPPVRTRAVMGKIGPIGIELLQPLEGHTVHRDLLETQGEGVGHIAYLVDDLASESRAMRDQGFEIILSIRQAGQAHPGAIYFDTRGRLSNLIVELIQPH